MITTTVTQDPRLKDLIANIKNIDATVKDAMLEKTLEVSLVEMQEIKNETPRDTGRAAASWGIFTPEDLTGKPERIGRAKTGKKVKFSAHGVSGHTQIASATDAIWEEDQANLSVIQGTAVPYMSYINDGTSQGKGREGILHIDRAFQRANDELGKFFGSLSVLISEIMQGRGGAAAVARAWRLRIPGTGERVTRHV